MNLQIRVGLNTGEMVLRSIRKDDLRTEYTPIGHSTSLAARMESLASEHYYEAEIHRLKRNVDASVQNK